MQTFPPENLLKSSPNPTWQRYLASLILLGLLALATAQYVRAQDRPNADETSPVQSTRSANAISLQVGGGSYMIGLQYQYRWANDWVGRAGIGGGPVIELFPFDETALLDNVLGDDKITESDVSAMVGLPLGVSWIPGSGDWRPEVGLSVAPGLVGGEILALWGGPTAGFRYHPTDGGLYLRAVGQRLVGTAGGETLGVWTVGLSIGYSF